MAAIFQSIAPIFVVLFVGVMLRRAPVFEPQFWTGLDRLGFYVLYPVLLFSTIAFADFGALDLPELMIAASATLVIMGLATLALWPVVKRFGVSGPTYSTIFQATMRWNGFVALAIAEKLFGDAGAALVALIMALVVIPINMAAIWAVAHFGNQGGGNGKQRNVLATMATNPIILAVAAALVVRQLPFELPGIATDALQLLARAALGMGLLAIGAGLRIDALLRPTAVVALPVVMKLLVFPSVMVGMGILFAVPADQMAYLALCAAVPTAMNGYVVARQMGGDAETYAVVVTMQTAVSILTIPAVLHLVALLHGG